MIQNLKLLIAPKGYLRVGINMSNFLLVVGKNEIGDPIGISPDIGKLVAKKIGVECKFILFDRPGQLADAVNDDIWDIGNIAFEPERGNTINFSNPYVLIDANFLVKNKTNLKKNEDIDKEENTIVVADRSAYDLWLKSNFKKSKIVRVKSIDASHDYYREGKANVLAGLRPKLIDEMQLQNDDKIIEKPFTFIKQSVGFKKNFPKVIEFINSIISEAIDNEYIKSSLQKYNVNKKLSIPKSN